MARVTIKVPTTVYLGTPQGDQRSRDMSGSIEVVSDGTAYVGGIDYAEGYHRSAQVTPNTMPRNQGNRHTRRRAAALARRRSTSSQEIQPWTEVDPAPPTRQSSGPR